MADDARPSGPTWRMALGVLRNSVTSFVEDGCSQQAAAIAYYALFSLFPLMLAVAAVFGVVLRNESLQQRVFDAIIESFPLEAPLVASQLRTLADLGPTVSVVSVIGALWASGTLATAVRSALDVVFSVGHGRPFLRAKVFDYVVVLAASTLFLASTVATMVWRIVQTRTDARFSDFDDQFHWVWDLGALAIPAVTTFLTFLVLYRALPHRATRLLHIWPGAIVAALAFEAAKVGFAAYLANFGNYQVVYGSVGGVIALMFWVYISANIMLFGAEISSEVGHMLRGEPRHGRPGAPGNLSTSLLSLLRGLVVAPPREVPTEAFRESSE